MNKTDFESLDNLMNKIINKDNFDKFDVEQAKILLAKIKYLKERRKEINGKN